MARTFASASSQSLTLAKAYLSGATQFTIGMWFHPANLTDTVRAVFACGTGSGAYWQLRLDAGVVVFESVGYTGTNPGTGSGITWIDTNGKFVAWRKTAAGEWSKWEAGFKSVINASITFTLPSVGAEFDVAKNWSGAYCSGTYAELFVIPVALTDYQLQEWSEGVAFDQLGGMTVAGVGYWPLRGNSSPERNYSIPADTLTLGNAPTQGTHPTIVPPALADVDDSAWVIDLFHFSGTRRIGSRGLGEEIDLDVLGASYEQLLIGDITISDDDPSDGGVILPAQTSITVTRQAIVGYFPLTWEWRQCPVRIREYDRVSHALVTEFVGQINDLANFDSTQMTFVCGGVDLRLLDQLAPRQVIEIGDAVNGLVDDTDSADTRRMDVGRPIPLVFGVAIVTLPFIKADPDGTSGGGGDFIGTWNTNAVVRAVFFDSDQNMPGLEEGLVFETAPGTPASATTTTFTVTGDQSLIYLVGTPIRQSSDAGVTWTYTTVASYSAGTVTVTEDILPVSPTAIGLVEYGGDFAVERDRYKFVGVNTTFLTTLRFASVPQAVVLAEIEDATYQNPADVIKFLLEDPDQGLGQTCNSASFAFAHDEFSGARGLGSAVNGALGGDGSQRAFRDVLDELCALRGAMIWRDPETQEWMIEVDRAPTEKTRTLEFGPGLKGDVAEILSINRTPLNQAVSTLVLRYSPGGRDRGTKSFLQQDYAYRARMNVITGIGGAEETIESQFIRDHETAARVLYYRGKKRERADLTVRFRMTRGGRRVRRGEVYNFLIQAEENATDRLTYPVRIVGRERRLNEFIFTAKGEYNSDIYTTTLATIQAAVSTPVAERTIEDAPQTDRTSNLILNADFSTGLKFDGLPPALVVDYTGMPEWLITRGGTNGITAFSITADQRAVGGRYLTVGTGSSGSAGPYIGSAMAQRVRPGNYYLPSIYLNSNATGGVTAGWKFVVQWYAGGTPTLDNVNRLRLVPGDINGFGWRRYYGIWQAPPTADSARLRVVFTANNTTYTLDAVQFERNGNLFGRPSEWARNELGGITPVNITPGELTVLVPGEPVHGTTSAFGQSAGGATGVTLSGSQTTLASVGPGFLTGVTARVQQTITGPASWYLAIDQGGGVLTTIASGLALTAGTTVGDADMQTLPMFLNAAVDIVAVPTSGTFSGGRVRVTGHYEKHEPPTS